MENIIGKLILKDSAKHKAILISRIFALITCVLLLIYALVMSNKNINADIFSTGIFKAFSIFVVIIVIITGLMLFGLAVLEVAEMKNNGEVSVISKLITNFVSLFVIAFLICRYFIKSNDSILSILLFVAVMTIANLGIDYWKRNPKKT